MANRIAHNGEVKVCTRCGPPAKPLGEFNRRSDRGGGYQSYCRDCQKDLRDAWYAQHRDTEYERTRAYLQAHPAVKVIADRTYRLAHPDVFRRSAARFRQTEHGMAEHRRIEGNRRAQKLNQFIEDVDPQIVYEMYGGKCGICNEFVTRDAFHVDHVIPLCRGGMHGYINVQPAHPLCNLRKGGDLR